MINTMKMVTLARHPKQVDVSSENFAMVEMPLPTLEAGQLLVKTLFIGVDAGSRAMMSQDPYVVNLKVGEPFVGTQIVEVIESNHDDFIAGDLIHTMSVWSDYSVLTPEQLGPWCYKVDAGVPLGAHLGGIGFTGFTAWVGMHEIAQLKETDTVVVSAAAGAVGFAAGQIARLQGAARVVGIAGGAEKCSYVVNEGKFDACIDYRASDFAEQLAAACPNGVDVYFENVGGEIQQTVLPLMNDFGRIPLCGQIAQYGDALSSGPNWFPLTLKRLTVRGFLANDHFSEYEKYLVQVTEWYKQGKYLAPTSTIKGLENCDQAINSLLSGQNIGRQLIQVADA